MQAAIIDKIKHKIEFMQVPLRIFVNFEVFF